MTGLRQERVANGLCPNCGEEAAPYYLCSRCRFRAKLGRVLRKGERAGALVRETCPDDRRTDQWSLSHKEAEWEYRDVTDPDDGRLQPRFRGVPVNVEDELIGILRREGRPMHEDEIVRAWGKLRVGHGKGSIARQLAKLITAEQKRKAKAERRSA